MGCRINMLDIQKLQSYLVQSLSEESLELEEEEDSCFLFFCLFL